MPTRPWPNQLLSTRSTALDPHTAKVASQLGMVQYQAARWVKNDYVQQSSVTQILKDFKWQDWAQRQTDARLSLMYKIVHNLVLIEAIKYVKLQRNLINLQQILSNSKYYEMSFFLRTVKDWNSPPKLLQGADSLKAFKAGVVSIEHHLHY